MNSFEVKSLFEQLMRLFRMAGEPNCHFVTSKGFKLPIVHTNKILRYVNSFFQIVFGVQILEFVHKGHTIKYDWCMTIEELLTIFGVDSDQPVITVLTDAEKSMGVLETHIPENILKPVQQVITFWCNNYMQPPSRAHVFSSAFQIYVARTLKSKQINLRTTFTAEGVLGYLEDIVSLTYPKVFQQPNDQTEFWPNNTVTKLILGDNPRAVFSLGFRSQERAFEE